MTITGSLHDIFDKYTRSYDNGGRYLAERYVRGGHRQCVRPQQAQVMYDH